MVDNKQQPKDLDRYEQYYSHQDSKHYELHWKATRLHYATVGSNGFDIECLQLEPESVVINERNFGSSYTRKMSLTLFNQRHPREQLDLRCNSHGFTFSNGHYFINNAQIPLLLADEFTKVPADEALADGHFDVVCFKEPLAGEWIHSAKFRHGRFLHKRGLQQYTMHSSIREIVGMSDYQDAIPYYFKRKAEAGQGIHLVDPEAVSKEALVAS